jgi:hypothetical protein
MGSNSEGRRKSEEKGEEKRVCLAPSSPGEKVGMRVSSLE